MEILALDIWTNQDGMRALYTDPSFTAAFDGLFVGDPHTWLLHRPTGEWVEW